MPRNNARQFDCFCIFYAPTCLLKYSSLCSHNFYVWNDKCVAFIVFIMLSKQKTNGICTYFTISLLRIKIPDSPTFNYNFTFSTVLNKFDWFSVPAINITVPKRLNLIDFQVQRVKVEKQLVEKQRFEVEEKFKRLSRQAEELNRKFEELREEKDQLVKENSRLKQQVRNCTYFN